MLHLTGHLVNAAAVAASTKTIGGDIVGAFIFPTAVSGSVDGFAEIARYDRK